jgi:hypothetical protein
MSNKASDHLHRLIKALSKPEKRYFKVFSSRHVIGDQNNYQRLFDAIDRQDEYDEALLIKKFKGEAFVDRFSIAKNRLYQSILKSLDAYHANSSIEAQLKRQIHAAEILYNKTLYAQALKILISARKVAEKHEKITSLIEIGRWEKRIIEKDNYEGFGKKEWKTMLDADRSLTARIDTYNELWSVKSRIFMNLYVKGKARSVKDLSKYKKILDELAVKQEREGMLTENHFLLNHLYSAYYFGVGDEAASYPYLKRNLALIESHGHIFSEDPTPLLSTLTNAIYVGNKLGLQEEAFGNLKTLRQLPALLAERTHEDLEIRIFALSNSIELALHTDAGNFEEGMKLVAIIEEGLLRYDEQLSSVRKASFFFNISVLYFKAKRLNEALKWINQLLNNIEIDKTQDIHCMGQILNLIIHLELGNKSLLPYALRSTQRFLETRQRVYRFENLFLEFVNEMVKVRRDKSDAEMYTGLADALLPLQNDPFEKQVFEYFDFHAWALEKSGHLM